MNWKDEVRKRKTLYRLDSNGAFTTCTEDVIADIESLLKERQWISVKDKLPEDKQSILFYIDEPEFVLDDRITTGIYLNGQFYDDDFNDWGLQASHWMPLPEPPTSELKGKQ